MMNEFGGHGWGMGWWWIIVLIIVVAVIWIVVKSMNRNSTTSQESKKTALEILKERYAKGEIDKQEFEDLKKELIP
jgi:putative membrane protein